jgi:hypothetical protein
MISLRDIIASVPRMGTTKKMQDKWIARFADDEVFTVQDLEKNPSCIRGLGIGFGSAERFIEAARKMGVQITISAFAAGYRHTSETNNKNHVRRMLRQAQERLEFWESEAVRFGIKGGN